MLSATHWLGLRALPLVEAEEASEVTFRPIFPLVVHCWPAKPKIALVSRIELFHASCRYFRCDLMKKVRKRFSCSINRLIVNILLAPSMNEFYRSIILLILRDIYVLFFGGVQFLQFVSPSLSLSELCSSLSFSLSIFFSDSTN